jgi:hypothetical protein
MAREIPRAGNRVDSTRSTVQEPKQGHQREFPLLSRSYSLQDSRSSYKQHAEDLPSTRRSGERIAHRWTVAEAVIPDRILTQNLRQHEFVYGISSRPNFYGMPLEQAPRMQDHRPQITPSKQTSRKLQKQNIPTVSQSQKKDLPAIPQSLQYYERATSFHQSTRSSHGYRSTLETSLETVEQRIQRYSKETQPRIQFIPETKKATIWGAILSLFRAVRIQYGENQVHSVSTETTDDIIASYPRGMKLFLILLSGALPYVVVSILPDLRLFPRLRH